MADWTLGTTYWPRRKGALLWAAWDRGEVRDELQQIATVGLDALRLPLHWEDFQPRPERVDSNTLRSLEQTLDLAADARLRVVPSLMPLAIAGAIHLPAWTTAASLAADMVMATKFGPLLIVRSESQPPLIWERTAHQTEVRDLWANPAMREAQRKLIAEVVGYFADHPALLGWELGSGIELARLPSSNDAAAEWLAETGEAMREHGARGPLFYAATLRSLTRRDGPRPESIVEAGCTPVVSLVPPEPAWTGQRLTADMLLFVAALVRSLCGTMPALIIGTPAIANSDGQSFADNAYGRAVSQPLVDPDSYAQIVESVLPDLRAAGSPGVWFAHAYCYGKPFVPEDSHSRRERMMGLFDTGGDPLPVALAVQRFAGQPAPDESRPLQAIDVEDYWADPAASFERLWRAWQTAEE